MKKYKVNIKKNDGDWEYYSEPLIVEANSISGAIKKAKSYLWRWRCENERPVSAEWVIRMLGRETWLSGLGRAAFHWTCTREGNGHSIHFDCSRMFK